MELDYKEIYNYVQGISQKRLVLFLWNGGVFYVPGERGVPAGGAGEHQAVLLDGGDQDEGRRGLSFRI